MGRKIIDLTGQKFGRLTVKEEAGKNKYGQVLWLCRCDCGTEKIVAGGHLVGGRTKSCGCLQKEQASIANKGKQFSEETRRKTSVANIGKKFSEETKRKLRGSNHHGWKGGISPLNHSIRNSLHSKEWRLQVFTGDSYTCQFCNQVGGKLQSHHKEHFSYLMERYNITTLEEAANCSALWGIDNGITLCKKCHKQYHSKQGTAFFVGTKLYTNNLLDRGDG